MLAIQDWQLQFDERQRKEIELAVLYERDFGHGTNGHNDLVIIAKMAKLLTAYCNQYGFNEDLVNDE